MSNPLLPLLVRLRADGGRYLISVGLTHEEREAQVLEERLRTLDEAVGPQSLAVVPHPSGAKGAWVPVAGSFQ